MKILFVSMSCLIDQSSGAAISVRTILRHLAARGHQVHSFSAACFDRAAKDNPVEMLQWAGFQSHIANRTWTFHEDGVTHVALPGKSCRIKERAAEDRSDLVAAAKDQIDALSPDILFCYGATPFDLNIRKHAKDNGAKVVFYLANPSYKSRNSFENTDLVVTDTQATANLYRARMGLDTFEIGKFVDRPKARRPEKRNRHITFVNPSYPKGVTLFYRIAELMGQTLPSARFMVVENRSTLREIEATNGIPFSQMRNLRRIGLQRDMADIFALSHVLLMPSLWHESGSRLSVEALSLGLPLVCSDHGGFPEIVGDGGIRLEVPDVLQKNNKLIPPTSVALPWVSALARLWTDEGFWDEKHAAALRQWQKHIPAPRVDRLETQLKTLIND